jgi:hypothetical protein
LHRLTAAPSIAENRRVNRRQLFFLGFGFIAGAAASSQGCLVDNADHCINGSGDSFCAARHGSDLPYCSDNTCVTPTDDGCVAEPPIGCWVCNGKNGNNDNCDSMAEGDGDGDSGDGDTGDGDGEPSGDGEPTGDGDPDTSPDCTDSSECGSSTPLCEDGSCVSCSASSLTCADEYPATVCDASSGACVTCTTEDTSQCPANAPACVDNECVKCSSHDQCPGSACELDVGTCFDSPVVHVDGDPGCDNGGDGSAETPYCTIAAAVANVTGQKRVVVLHEAAGPYYESITVAGNGTMVAFIGAAGEKPVWQNQDAANASLRADNGAAVYAHSVAFRSSTNSAVVVSLGGKASLTLCRISGSDLAAVSVSDGTLFVQNSFVGVQAIGVPAVSLSAGTLKIEYSTIGAGFGGNASAVVCTNGGAGSTIRNSIALNYSAAAEIACANATVENVFVDATFDEDSNWFVDFANGDFHIAPNAPTTFTEPLSTFATWTTGDPLFDIDGDARVGIDGASDYAGADVP